MESEFYNLLGQFVLDSINSDWEDATLYIESIDDGVVNYSGEYRVNGKSLCFDFPNYDISDEVEKFKEYSHKHNFRPWNFVEFYLDNNEKFKIKFLIK